VVICAAWLISDVRQAKRMTPRRKRLRKSAEQVEERVPVDETTIRSSSSWTGPWIPDYYEDRPFTCKDCGKAEVWTASQQKWWYEVVGGTFETTAIRCRKCRAIERARKAEARRIHLEGIQKKKDKTA
jgi:hypothetical protein